MSYTESIQDRTESTTTDEAVTITVPDNVVDAIADRLDAHEDPGEDVAHDLALDHVDMSHRLVTERGVPVEQAALERAGEESLEELVDVPLDDDTLAEIDAAAGRAGVTRLEWIRRAVDGRTYSDDVTVAFDEEDVDSAGVDPTPIDVEATAQLDYAEDPERPLSIDLTIPADVVDEDSLDDLLGAVTIDATLE